MKFELPLLRILQHTLLFFFFVCFLYCFYVSTSTIFFKFYTNKFVLYFYYHLERLSLLHATCLLSIVSRIMNSCQRGFISFGYANQELVIFRFAVTNMTSFMLDLWRFINFSFFVVITIETSIQWTWTLNDEEGYHSFSAMIKCKPGSFLV